MGVSDGGLPLRSSQRKPESRRKGFVTKMKYEEGQPPFIKRIYIYKSPELEHTPNDELVFLKCYHSLKNRLSKLKSLHKITQNDANESSHYERSEFHDMMRIFSKHANKSLAGRYIGKWVHNDGASLLLADPMADYRNLSIEEPHLIENYFKTHKFTGKQCLIRYKKHDDETFDKFHQIQIFAYGKNHLTAVTKDGPRNYSYSKIKEVHVDIKATNRISTLDDYRAFTLKITPYDAKRVYVSFEMGD